MTPYFEDRWLTVYGGDARVVLRELTAESVHCVVTSPPYWAAEPPDAARIGLVTPSPLRVTVKPPEP